MARRDRDDPYEINHRLACLDIPEVAEVSCRDAHDLLDRVARWGDHKGRYYASTYLLRRLSWNDTFDDVRQWRDELLTVGEATTQPLGRDPYGDSVVLVLCPERLERWPRFHKKRAVIPPAVRRAVFARDDYTCRHCGRRSHLAIDHIFPWSLGGTDDIDNLQTLCQPCNSRKGARTDALVQSR